MIKTIKASDLISVSALEILHFVNFRSGKLVAVFDGALADFFIDNDVVDVLLDRLGIRNYLLIIIAFLCILVSL